MSGLGCRRRSDADAGRWRTAPGAAADAVLLGLAVLFALGGAGFGHSIKQEGDEAKDFLSEAFEDDETRMAFVVYFVLATVMAGLWFWARTAPFSAMLTALWNAGVLVEEPFSATV